MDISGILYQPKNNIAYLHNPKVACSTIKNSLLRGEVDNVHEQFLFPPYNNSNVPIFSVVRNPYSRSVSAYLDKIGKDKDFYVWFPFCRKYGLDRESNLSFVEFLRLLDGTEDKNSVDHHFRPQHLNLLHEYVRPNFIGYIEDMRSVEEYLKKYYVQMLRRSPHKTKSSSMAAELFSGEAVELIKKIYKEDFEIYGYSEKVGADFNLEPIVKDQWVSDDVAFGHSRLDLNHCVELFRDSAIALENVDIRKSYELMKLACKLRPMGGFINEKMSDYESILSKED